MCKIGMFQVATRPRISVVYNPVCNVIPLYPRGASAYCAISRPFIGSGHWRPTASGRPGYVSVTDVSVFFITSTLHSQPNASNEYFIFFSYVQLDITQTCNLISVCMRDCISNSWSSHYIVGNPRHAVLIIALCRS